MASWWLAGGCGDSGSIAGVGIGKDLKDKRQVKLPAAS